MGKVYDALQRAESERKRRASGGMPEGHASAEPREPGLDFSHAEASPRPAPQPSRGLLRRLGRWLPRRKKRRSAEAGAINKRRISLLHPESFATEQFRSLRAHIDSLATKQSIRTLAVTSAVAGEGKTLSSINLAVVVAMGVGRRVLLVDCDLRTPKIAEALGIVPVAGLGEVLLDEVALDQAIHKVEGANLEVLPVRSQPRNPSELLASERMRNLVKELAQGYDRVVLDTPACLAVPDARTVSELADGVVLVVRADQTPQEDVTAALDVLDRQRVLGVVLNGANIQAERYGY